MFPIMLQISNVSESIKNRSQELIKNEMEIEFLINRIKEKYDGELICIVTSDSAEDDFYESISKKCCVNIIRGKYECILDRMKLFVEKAGCASFIRILGNYPLVDLTQIPELIKKYQSDEYDYAYNEHIDGVLWGMGCEIFNSNLIDRLIGLNLEVSQQEAIGFYLRQHSDEYQILRYTCASLRKSFKVNLESKKDLAVIREIVNNVDNITNESVSNYLNKHSVLAEYNLEEPSKEVGVDKILLNPDKIKNILMEDESVGNYPISVELTLTNACNLRCVYCSDLDLREKQGNRAHMDKDVLYRLFDDLARGGTKGVTIEGGGEPSIYPEFEDVVNYATDKGLAVGLITNGVKSIPPNVVKKFEWIRVSLDASTPEEYLALKGVDCFEQVMNNIAFYTKECGTVGVGYVVTNQNLSQIEALVLRLRDMGASYIQLRPVVDNDMLYPHDVDLSYLKVFSNKKFGVIVDGMKENAESGNKHLPCVANGITSVISGDGSVYLCGRLNVYSWLEPIGNINKNSFSEIWDGEIRRKQKQMVMDKEFCYKNCPQCRVTKFNELFDRAKNVKSKNFI